jgi:hypothetical protein
VYLFFRRFFFQKTSPFSRILGSTKTASGNRLLPRLNSKVSIKSINKQTPQSRVHPDQQWPMYHGTSRAVPFPIKQGGVHGLQPSKKGMLGVGVYCSRELQKARAYATGNGGVY